MPKSTDGLRHEVLALADIAKACPENLQEKCFELLLADPLARRTLGPGGEGVRLQEAPTSVEVETPRLDLPAGETSDISTSDLHVKARHFLQKYAIKIDDINQLLYKEGDQFLPLYEDLKTTRTAESQIRLALLDALTTGLRVGEFAFDGERVRSACTVRKCYDPKNFTANFRNNASLFDGFDGYSKEKPTVRLSEDGQRELAELVRELL